jgi:DNA-binding XRE family transcriptional regulator
MSTRRECPHVIPSENLLAKTKIDQIPNHLEMRPILYYMIEYDQYGQFTAMGQVETAHILTPALCRAARGFLDWTQSDLAEHAGISRSTIRDYEADRHTAHRATLAQLQLAFERAGVSFRELGEGNLAVCGSDRPQKVVTEPS